MPRSAKSVYLTFDDGPIPEITPWILDVLAEYEAQATFFCVGQNIEKNPDIYRRIHQEGHSVGNHTHRHLNARHVDRKAYLADVAACREHCDSALFRPPYGRLPASYAKALLADGYRIVMWDVLSGDFDVKRSPADCLAGVVKSLEPGSVVVFHDNVKSIESVRHALPRLLAHIKERGWTCSALKP